MSNKEVSSRPESLPLRKPLNEGMRVKNWNPIKPVVLAA